MMDKFAQSLKKLIDKILKINNISLPSLPSFVRHSIYSPIPHRIYFKLLLFFPNFLNALKDSFYLYDELGIYVKNLCKKNV